MKSIKLKSLLILLFLTSISVSGQTNKKEQSIDKIKLKGALETMVNSLFYEGIDTGKVQAALEGLTDRDVKRMVNSAINHVNVKDFGAIADYSDGKGTDNFTSFQSAIDFVLYAAAGKKTLFIPAGRYKIGNMLNIGKGRDYVTMVILGDGGIAPYDPNNKGGGTSLYFTHPSRAGINIQGARRVIIDGIYMQGMNELLFDHIGGEAQIVEKNYTNISLPPEADQRYETNAAISIDKYSGEKPGQLLDSYAPNGWNLHMSSQVTVQNCVFYRWITGIVSQMSGSDGNGDFIHVYNNHFSDIKYPVSISQTQARQTFVIDNHFDRAWIAITTGTHGMKSGRVNVIARNHFGGYSAIYLPVMSWNGTCTIQDNYAEVLYMIGGFGNDNSYAPIPQFLNNHWSMDTLLFRSKPKQIAYGYQAHFSGDIITGSVTNISSNGRLTFDGVMFGSHPDPQKRTWYTHKYRDCIITDPVNGDKFFWTSPEVFKTPNGNSRYISGIDNKGTVLTDEY
ncbi:MAG: hypothetical protein WKF91_12875 [Segetibacter sp.]